MTFDFQSLPVLAESKTKQKMLLIYVHDKKIFRHDAIDAH